MHRRLGALPPKIQLGIGAAVLAVLGIAAYFVFTTSTFNSASLRFTLDHSFRSADVSVAVDGKVVYQGKSIGVVRKRYGLIPDGLHGALAKQITVPEGQHVVQVHVVAPSEGYDQTRTASGSFSAATENALGVVATRGGLSISWQGGQVLAAQTGSENWLQKYAGSLLLSILGTIMSATLGFMVQEFLKSRTRKSASA